MLGDVGQIEVVQANIRDQASVARALDGAEGCVNAVAVLYESGRQTFDALHVEGAEMVAAEAKAQGVSRFVQISALGADADSASDYAATKAAGEAMTLQHLPQAVVLRPSVIFGPGDSFFNRFAAMALVSPVLPLIGGGHTRFQPVFVGDVAAAVAHCIADPAASGKIYELGGPSIYSFRELMEVMLNEIGRNRVLIPIPFGLAKLIGVAGDLMAFSPIAPLVTSDQVELLRSDNVVTPGMPGLADLGIVPVPLESIIPTYLYRYRKGGQYADITAAAPAR
jgi:NADH dehydrogenase